MNKPPRFPPIQTPKNHGIRTVSSVKVEKLCSRMRSSQPGPCLRAVCPGLFSKEGSGSVTAYLGSPVPGKRQYLQADLGYSGPHWHYPEFPGGRLKAQAIREGFLKERGGGGGGGVGRRPGLTLEQWAGSQQAEVKEKSHAVATTGRWNPPRAAYPRTAGCPSEKCCPETVGRTGREPGLHKTPARGATGT